MGSLATGHLILSVIIFFVLLFLHFFRKMNLCIENKCVRGWNWICETQSEISVGCSLFSILRRNIYFLWSLITLATQQQILRLGFSNWCCCLGVIYHHLPIQMLILTELWSIVGSGKIGQFGWGLWHDRVALGTHTCSICSTCPLRNWLRLWFLSRSGYLCDPAGWNGVKHYTSGSSFQLIRIRGDRTTPQIN